MTGIASDAGQASDSPTRPYPSLSLDRRAYIAYPRRTVPAPLTSQEAKTVQVTFRLPRWMLDDIDLLARATGLGRSFVVKKGVAMVLEDLWSKPEIREVALQLRSLDATSVDVG